MGHKTPAGYRMFCVDLREGDGVGLNDRLLPTPPRAPLGPLQRPWLPASPSQPLLAGRAQGPTEGRLPHAGTRPGAGGRSAQGPWVASRKNGAGHVPGNGRARPLAAAMEVAPPQPHKLGGTVRAGGVLRINHSTSIS